MVWCVPRTVINDAQGNLTLCRGYVILVALKQKPSASHLDAPHGSLAAAIKVSGSGTIRRGWRVAIPSGIAGED